MEIKKSTLFLMLFSAILFSNCVVVAPVPRGHRHDQHHHDHHHHGHHDNGYHKGWSKGNGHNKHHRDDDYGHGGHGSKKGKHHHGRH